MKLQDRITKALSALIGLPLWRAHRAMDVEVFAFGERRPRRNRKGKEAEVGEYALHIQCPWRIVGPDGMVVGSEDRNYPEDENADRGEFDSDGPSRCESRMAGWLKGYSTAPLKVERVEADYVGGFKLFFQQGFVMEAFPANSLQGEYSERWRLLRPSEEERHFVVCGYGTEE